MSFLTSNAKAWEGGIFQTIKAHHVASVATPAHHPNSLTIGALNNSRDSARTMESICQCGSDNVAIMHQMEVCPSISGSLSSYTDYKVILSVVLAYELSTSRLVASAHIGDDRLPYYFAATRDIADWCCHDYSERYLCEICGRMFLNYRNTEEFSLMAFDMKNALMQLLNADYINFIHEWNWKPYA